jgi:hypothetical protein
MVIKHFFSDDETVLFKARYIYWTQNNCELHWPFQVYTQEGGEDRKAIARKEKETNPFLVLYNVKQLGSGCRL